MRYYRSDHYSHSIAFHHLDANVLNSGVGVPFLRTVPSFAFLHSCIFMALDWDCLFPGYFYLPRDLREEV